MTQEGINELQNFLSKFKSILNSLPELQKLVDVDKAVEEKQRLKAEADAAYVVAKTKVDDAEDLAKRLKAQAEKEFEDARVEIKRRLDEANAKSDVIIQVAKNAEDEVMKRVKAAQDLLANLTRKI